MSDRILIRYGELSLKKSNRKQFTDKMKFTIKRALKDYPNLEYLDCSMRFYIILNDVNPDLIIPILKKIPGIYSFSIVSYCEKDLDKIKELSCKLLKEELAHNEGTIKVNTSRSDKDFPMESLEISKAIASYLFKNIPNLKADVHDPKIVLNVDLRVEGCFIYTNIHYGLGGLPNGSIGKVELLISGGIDSVVAGYLGIRKGMEIEAIHYASPPYTSDMAVQKVIDLLEKLTPYTEYQSITLIIVPFTKIQQAIYDNCRDDYCITIMRRMMYRIADRLARERNALGILNGENIGQVASQTLESIQTIGSVTDLPVIRPLSTMDKSEIIEIAKQIDTYDISIRPYEDCCTVFVPKHPQIKPRKEMAESQEKKFDYQSLIDEAVNNVRYIKLTTNKHHDIFLNDDNIF